MLQILMELEIKLGMEGDIDEYNGRTDYGTYTQRIVVLLDEDLFAESAKEVEEKHKPSFLLD